MKMNRRTLVSSIVAFYVVAITSIYFLGARGPGLIFIIILFTVLCGGAIILGLWRSGVESRVPTYVSRVKLVSKDFKENMMVPLTGVECYVTFQFPDGIKKTFPIGVEANTELHEGESGTLTYKELGNYLVFVHFERPD